MNKKTFFFVVILLLALIFTLFYDSFFNGIYDEPFINTQSCISLSTDEINTANTFCNNMIGSDASGCSHLISSYVCPIDKKGGIAENAALFDKVTPNVPADSI